MEFVIKVFRTLFYSLDKIIYGLIDDVYGLLVQISRTSVFSDTVIHEFAERIYALVGLFMLFKVTVSLVSYILNPDDFSDKDKGFTSIIKRVVLSLFMIALVPYIFQEAYDLQAIVLQENTIMNLVFGTPSNKVNNEAPNASYVDSAGKQIQFTVMFAFAQPNYEEWTHDQNFDLTDCRNTYVIDSTGRYQFRTDTTHYIYKLQESCYGRYVPEGDDDGSDVYVCTEEDDGDFCKLFQQDDKIKSVYQDVAQGIAQQSFSLFFKKQAILAKDSGDDGRYYINYKFGISTAVGIAVLYIFLLYCIDIAVRSVKLGFLQMIAPIPILSYIDPKSGKDGMFSKWLKMCKDTYLELFIRLFSLFFGIYAITLIGEFRDVTTGDIVNNWFVKLFMILGILIFVKKLPGILKEVFNFKGEGKFNFNPLKKIEEEAFGGKRLTGLAAGAAIGAAGMATGAGLGRGLSGAWQGFMGNKGWSDTLKDQRGRNATMRTSLLDGSTFGGRMRTRISDIAGTGGELARIEHEKKQVQNAIDEEKNRKEAIESQIAPKRTEISRGKATASAISAMQDRAYNKLLEGKGSAGADYQQRVREQERLKTKADALAAKAGQTGLDSDIAAAQAAAEAYKLQQQADEKWAHSTGRDALLKEFLDGTTSDDKFQDLRAAYESAAATSGHTVETTAAGLDRQNNQIGHDVQSIQSSIAGQERAIQEHDDRIKGYNEQMQGINERETVAKANSNAVKR